MKNTPLVSICIPTYNRAAMVGRAIESALNQTYHNIEVIVVDNASTDNIEEVIAVFDDPRLTFVKNNENLGLFGNFNRCIDLYNGDFLHILHSDDYIDQEFTETCVQFFEAHPDVFLTSTSSRTIAGDSTKDIKFAESDVIFKAPEGFRQLLSERSYISCPSVMVRRGLYEKVGKFSLEYPYSSDYYQWLKVARNFDIAYIRNARVYYRCGEHSESYKLLFTTPVGYLDTLKIYVQLLQDLGDESGFFTRELNSAFKRFIRDCVFAGITRADTMKNFSSGLFTGIAFSTWSLMKPVTRKDVIFHFSEWFFIAALGILMNFSVARKLLKYLVSDNMDVY